MFQLERLYGSSAEAKAFVAELVRGTLERCLVCFTLTLRPAGHASPAGQHCERIGPCLGAGPGQQGRQNV